MSNDKKETKIYYLALGMCFGVTFGIIFDNLAMGIILGSALGLLVDAYINKKSKNNDKK